MQTYGLSHGFKELRDSSRKTFEGFGRVYFAGFVATTVMTLALLPIATLSHAPILDFATLMGGVLFQRDVSLYSSEWWFGLLGHYLNGTILFPMLYAFVLFPYIPGHTWSRGAIWGMFLWLLTQFILMPLMGFGVFSSAMERPSYGIFVTFNGLFLYGLLLGGIVGPMSSPQHDEKVLRSVASKDRVSHPGNRRLLGSRH